VEKEMAKRSVTISVKTPKQTEEKGTLKDTIGMVHLCGFMR
jgi:hypothetical protein